MNEITLTQQLKITLEIDAQLQVWLIDPYQDKVERLIVALVKALMDEDDLKAIIKQLQSVPAQLARVRQRIRTFLALLESTQQQVQKELEHLDAQMQRLMVLKVFFQLSIQAEVLLWMTTCSPEHLAKILLQSLKEAAQSLGLDEALEVIADMPEALDELQETIQQESQMIQAVAEATLNQVIDDLDSLPDEIADHLCDQLGLDEQTRRWLAGLNGEQVAKAVSIVVQDVVEETGLVQAIKTITEAPQKLDILQRDIQSRAQSFETIAKRTHDQVVQTSKQLTEQALRLVDMGEEALDWMQRVNAEDVSNAVQEIVQDVTEQLPIDEGLLKIEILPKTRAAFAASVFEKQPVLAHMAKQKKPEGSLVLPTLMDNVVKGALKVESSAVSAQYMMALGQYRFSLDSAAYQKLGRQISFLWPTQQHLTGFAKPQFVGFGEQTIQLSGDIYPEFKGGVKQIDAMVAEAAQGKPLNLVTGTGENLGQWCIGAIQSDTSLFFRDGAPRKISFQMKLVYFGNA